MADLVFRHVYKVYPNGVKAVNDFTMEIDDKDFIVFVGSSGCGKSTTLRMIAGLEEITSGELYIGGKLVNDIEPKDRDIAMVFQNYALYPHMTVYNNMAFGLRLRKVPEKLRDASKAVLKGKNGKKAGLFRRLFARTLKEARDSEGYILKDEQGNTVYETVKIFKGKEIKIKGKPIYKKRPYNIDEYAGPVVLDENGNPVLVTKKDRNGNTRLNKKGELVYKLVKLTSYEIMQKVYEAARILDITEYLARKPKAMSGGQRQRVALGRAIVREPKVFLLDEPLSNLDAKLRTSMRSEISKLYKKLQTTFIYVTHDQVEAMTLGTRIVVMRDGYIQQIDTPRNLYSYPTNKFVAGFIGTPQMNFFNCRLKRTDDGKNITVTLDDAPVVFTVPMHYFAKANSAYFDGVRPVVMGIRSEHMTINDDRPFRTKCRVFYVEDLGVENQIYATLDLSENTNPMESPSKLVVKAPVSAAVLNDSIIDIAFDFSQIHLFDAQTECTIAPRIPESYTADIEVKDRKLHIYGAVKQLPPAIALENGCYKAVLPAAAVSIGGAIKAEYIGEEQINKSRLLEFHTSDGNEIFIMSDSGDIGEGIDIDLKYCSFMYRDGQTAVEGLRTENEIEVKLHKIKDKENTRYEFLSGDLSFDCPTTIADRLVAIAGKNIFKDELTLRFGLYDVSPADNGFCLHVDKMLDYGEEKFAVCQAGANEIIVSLNRLADDNCIRLTFDWNRVSVVNKSEDIQLI